MNKLNIGCEDDIKVGWVNVDLYPRNDKVIKLDLDKLPYPIPDNHYDLILASHILEHLNNPIEVLKELYRISKDGAIIEIRVPHFSHLTNHADLTHNKDWSYFSLGERWTNKSLLSLFIVDKRLNFNRINHTWMNLIFNPIINLCPAFYERFLCYILPCSEIIFRLTVTKFEEVIW